MNDDEVIRDVLRKIEREKALLNAANTMRQSTNNPAVISRLEAQHRDGRRNIDYLEGRLRELQMRKMNQDMGNMSMGGSNGGPLHASAHDGSRQSGGRHNPLPLPPKDERGGYGGQDGDYGDPPPGGYSQLSGGHGFMPPRAPYAPPGPGGGAPKAKSNYSKLGRTVLTNCKL